LNDQPRISDDGKFYWDGMRWVPMPGTAMPMHPRPQAPQQVNVQVRGQMPAWAAIAGLVLCAPLGLIMVGFTPWRVPTKVVVAGAAILIWIVILAATSHH